MLDTKPDGFEVVVTAASDPWEVLRVWMAHGGPTPVDPRRVEERRPKFGDDSEERHFALKYLL